MRHRVFYALWKKWIRFAEFIGNVQLTIILTIIFFVIIGLMYMPFRVMGDHLRIKKHHENNWKIRRNDPDIFESMKNQY